MIIDVLVVLLALVLGYLLFMSSAYLLAKWMLPRIEAIKTSPIPSPMKDKSAEL